MILLLFFKIIGFILSFIIIFGLITLLKIGWDILNDDDFNFRIF